MVRNGMLVHNDLASDVEESVEPAGTTGERAMVANDARMLAAGLVRHVDGNLHVSRLDTTFGSPVLTEYVRPALGEVFGGGQTTYTMAGEAAAADELFSAFRGAKVLDHPAPPSGNLMAPPFSTVGEGQSALIAQTWGTSGPAEHLLVFGSEAPPSGIKDALAALEALTAKARAQGPDATGGAAGML